MNSIHQIHRFSKRYSIEDLRYACHGQAVPLVHICGLTTAEYSLPIPYTAVLDKYISRQEEQKTYLVNRESMIRYEGRKYSVPTRYIGERMTVKETDGNLNIYYSGELVVCHAISSKMYNYTLGTAYDILKSDAMKHRTDAEIVAFVQQNLLNMDKHIGGL